MTSFFNCTHNEQQDSYEDENCPQESQDEDSICKRLAILQLEDQEPGSRKNVHTNRQNQLTLGRPATKPRLNPKPKPNSNVNLKL